MKILITGGSGFIGTNLINFYRQKIDIKIFNIDIVKPRDESQNNYWIQEDIMNFIKLNKLILDIKPNIIIHLAARTDLDGKEDNDYIVNVDGTKNVIKAIKNCASVEKVIFASSMLVCHAGYIPKNNDDYSYDTVYGKSKANMEMLIKNSEMNSICTIVRPTSIWGPWFVAPYKSFFNMVLKGMFFHPGNRACSKTYGYVGNLVFQIHKILNSSEINVNNKVFYLGDKPSINISQWADEIKNIAKGKNNIKLPYWVFIILAKIGDILNLFSISFPMTSFRLKNMTTDNILNLDELFKVVGKCPYDRQEGTKITLDWLLKNK